MQVVLGEGAADTQEDGEGDDNDRTVEEAGLVGVPCIVGVPAEDTSSRAL